MTYYFSLEDPQNIIPTLLITESDGSIFKKTVDEIDQTSLYLSQNISSSAIFASYPSENIQKNTDLNCHSSTLEYSTASNYPQSQRLLNKSDYYGEDRLAEEKLLNAKKTNKNPIICEYANCGKKFAFASELKRHLSLHCKEQSFICTICQKSFSRLDNLKAHERLHTNEKPFACGFHGCEEKFKNRSSLTHHANKHANEDLRCKLKNCFKKFNNKKDLDKHYMFTHQIDVQFIDSLGETYENSTLEERIAKEKKFEKIQKKKIKVENTTDFVDTFIAEKGDYKDNLKSFEIFFDEIHTKTQKKSET